MTDLDELRNRLDLPDADGLDPSIKARFNLAPSQNAPVIVLQDGKRTLKVFRWGLIPSWAKDVSIGYKLINARSESLDEKPSFRQAFAKRRCLVPASGFFEWKKIGSTKAPYLMRPAGGGLLMLAGLYEIWRQPDGVLLPTFTILTCEPNALLSQLHDRMPVILDDCGQTAWLNPATELASLKALCVPAPDDLLVAEPVDSIVNSPKNEIVDCIVPIGPALTL